MKPWTNVAQRNAVEPDNPLAVTVGDIDLGVYEVEGALYAIEDRLEALHWAVLEQNQLVLESLPDDAREREFLYDHDLGIARVRRMLEKRAAEQAQQFAALQG